MSTEDVPDLDRIELGRDVVWARVSLLPSFRPAEMMAKPSLGKAGSFHAGLKSVRRLPPASVERIVVPILVPAEQRHGRLRTGDSFRSSAKRTERLYGVEMRGFMPTFQS